MTLNYRLKGCADGKALCQHNFKIFNENVIKTTKLYGVGIVPRVILKQKPSCALESAQINECLLRLCEVRHSLKNQEKTKTTRILSIWDCLDQCTHTITHAQLRMWVAKASWSNAVT